jgi:hydroxyacyl-ACP dehydratase HTD2-like protein with hotdog domain
MSSTTETTHMASLATNLEGASNISSIKVGASLPERSYTPSNVSLFMYNAAIWNPHRIHYDAQYTTEVEKHPGIVIDGPLQGDWLTQCVMDWAGTAGTLVEFEYSNRKASYLGQTLSSGGEVLAVNTTTGEVKVQLHIKDESGEVTTPGSATVKFSA